LLQIAQALEHFFSCCEETVRYTGSPSYGGSKAIGLMGLLKSLLDWFP